MGGVDRERYDEVIKYIFGSHSSGRTLRKCILKGTKYSVSNLEPKKILLLNFIFTKLIVINNSNN